MDFEAVNEYLDRIAASETEIFMPENPETLKVGLDLGTAYIVLVVLDENDQPVAMEKQAAKVLKDGVVVDYIGACRIVKELKEKIEERIGVELTECAIAMPHGTDSSVKTHQYVAETNGMQVINVLDEPTAANAVYNISDGAIVDIGGGTTGLAIFKDGEVIQTEDEPTGGYHLSLVLAGSLGVDLDKAEEIKMDYDQHDMILPIVRPVLEKMSSITKKYIDEQSVDCIYLCGGTCRIKGIEDVFAKDFNIPVVKANDPFLVTPAGIAKNCVRSD